MACAYLTLRQKEELWWFTFLPIGRVFLGGSHCGAVPLAESVTPCQREIGPLGGTFIEEVTTIVGSARYGLLINIGALHGCHPFRILPLPSLLLSYTSLCTYSTTHPQVERFVESPSTSRQDAGEAYRRR